MSPKSINTLRRQRSRVDKDIADMDNRIAPGSTGRSDKFMIRETEETIKSIKESIE